MAKVSSKRDRRRKPSPLARTLKWIVGLAVLALVVYGFSQLSGVPFDENDIRVVNFSGLTPGEKRSALQAANRERCTCGCGMNLAQCVATDMTCPVRERNVESIRALVREADKS
jgi:hypothetical protein